jgi:hypothetical protein
MNKEKIDLSNERLIVDTYLCFNDVDELGKAVEDVFAKHGWTACIVDKKWSYDDPYYIFIMNNKIEIHETPFSQETNIVLTEEELFDGDNIRDKEDAFKLLKKRIGEPVINLKKALDDGDIDKIDYKIIKAIMKEEKLIEAHEINNTEFRCGARTFKYFHSEEDYEEYCRDYLQDGEMWRDAVHNRYTTLGLDDWIEDIIQSGEVMNYVSSYDGQKRSVDVDNENIIYYRIN